MELAPLSCRKKINRSKYKEDPMSKVRRILAPTDYSELSHVGLRRAFEMAREMNAELIVLHVVAMTTGWFSQRERSGEVRDLMTEQKNLLDRFLRTKFADEMNLVEVRQKVELGTPYLNIAELAEREAVDMIVMSTHGRTGLDHILLGSVTEKVIAHAPCPVMAIPVVKHDPLPKAA
jgi:nucleotide-binding universal stress UspA family protein